MISAVMVTKDRIPKPNYVDRTLAGLLLNRPSAYLKSLDVFVSDSDGERFAFSCCSLGGVELYVPAEDLCANENVAIALRHGAKNAQNWVLFMEDDIDVCADFFDSVALWLEDHVTSMASVYVFGSVVAGDQVDIPGYGASATTVPVEGFYGTQCFALRSEDAVTLSKYLIDHCYDINDDGTCYDLLMHRWSRLYHPNQNSFVVSCPSFVQHIGMESIINPRDNVHTFPSFPGSDWSYVEHRRPGR